MNSPNNTPEGGSTPSWQKFSLQKTQNMVHTILQNHLISPENWAKQMKEHEQKTQENQKKSNILRDNLQMTPEETQNRPQSADLDPKNIREVEVFLAKHNLACAFSCCGEITSADRVQEISDIIRGNFDENSHIHFSLYSDPDWENIQKNDPEEALEYFQVWLRPHPQNPEEKHKILEEIRKIHHSAQK